MKARYAACLAAFVPLIVLAADRTALGNCDTTITSGPSGYISNTSATFQFTSSLCLRGAFYCKLDAGSFASCTSPKTYSGLTNGSHTFQVYYTGDNTPATRTWTVDTIPPDTTINSGPAGGSIVSSPPTYGFVGNEPTMGFMCKIDSNPYDFCSSPYTVPAGTTAGEWHYFFVIAIDLAGNVDASPDFRMFQIDATPPDTSITSAPPSPTGNSTLSFSFSSTESGTFDCSMDGVSWATCSSPKSYSSVANGSHEFRVRAIDVAGNVDQTPAYSDITVNAPGCQ